MRKSFLVRRCLVAEGFDDRPADLRSRVSHRRGPAIDPLRSGQPGCADGRVATTSNDMIRDHRSIPRLAVGEHER